MAFLQLVLKANRLKRARQRYDEEKQHSIAASRGEKVQYTFRQRIRHKKVLLKRKIRNCLKRLIFCSDESWLYKRIVLLKTEGTLENYVLRSIFGFLGGLFLTYMFFIFFVFQLHFGLILATFICSVLGVILTIGLAFSPYVRCLVLLFLPTFFSKRGRQALMAYAFILTLAGPGRNTLHNLSVLTESLACVQGQLKEAVQSVLDLVKHPFHALKDTITKIVKSIKAIVKRIKEMLMAIKRIVLSILRVIESAFEWLGSIVKVCNRDFGTPYERCQRMFEGAVKDCKERLGDTVGKVCEVTNIARTVCLPLKPMDVICTMVSFVSTAIVDEVKEKLRKFSREMRAMFYVKIEFSHYYHMETNKSRSLGEISSEVSSEIKEKTRRFFGIFSWAGFITSFFFIFLFLRVMMYRYKWLTNDRFDNHYLSSYMREIDLKRARQDKETVFPLNWRERNKYASPSSILLIQSEKIKLTKSAVFLVMACTKIAIYMAIDYCLFWTLDTIRMHGKTEPKEKQRKVHADSVQVQGEGFIADMFRGIAKAFSPYNRDPEEELEQVSCLPTPKPPNYDSYVQIAVLVLFCWIMALFEPYGLRLRHIVLSQYYPDRAKQRAIWLYNNIIRSRGSFLKFARRQLRRQFGTAHKDGIERVSVRERLWATFPILNKIAPLKQKKVCLLCGQPERDKSTPHVPCPTPSCIGLYCPQCFQDLEKLCTICKSPMDYGDLTDLSQERDSSEEEVDQAALRERGEALRVKIEEQKALDEEEREKGIKVVKDASDDESSKYSYSYQDEPAEEFTQLPKRISFKDVEAQPIHDDVTMQIFSEPICEDVSSSSDAQVFCFGLGRRRTYKKKIVDSKKIKSDSTSIADTESWTTEEVDDQPEEVLEIEIEDFEEDKCSEDELLPKTHSKKRKRKRSKLKQLLNIFGKMIFFAKKKEKKTTKNYKDSIHVGDGTGSSSSSVSSITDENCELLASSKSKSEKKDTLRRRNNKIFQKSYAQQGSCICSHSLQEKKQSDNEKFFYPHEMKFETKELPWYMKSVCNNTKYYEVDENSSYYNSPREIYQYRTDISTLTDTRSSVDSDPSRERQSTFSEVDDNDSYIYTSENNNEKYYEENSTSDSFLPEDLEFSETSTDIPDKRGRLCLDNDKALMVEDKENKINEDSDEKSTIYRRRNVSDQINFESSTSDMEKFCNNYRFQCKEKTISTRGKEKYSKMIDRTFKESVDSSDSTEKQDILKSVKVEKETANARKKSSLILEKSSDYDNESISEKKDKSVNVKEINVKRSMKLNESKSHQISFEQMESDKNEKVRVDSTTAIEKNKTQIDDIAQCLSHPMTKDQGTYVRLTSRKAI